VWIVWTKRLMYLFIYVLYMLDRFKKFPWRLSKKCRNMQAFLWIVCEKTYIFKI